MTNFCSALCAKSGQFIKLSTNPEEINRTKLEFYELCSLPGVIGAIDGSHIRITVTGPDERAYINRKNFHSINCLALVDNHLRFLALEANSPGSSHDS